MLLDLPEEVTLCVCSFLTVQDLFLLACVCKHLERVTSDPVLWRDLFESSSDKLITMVPALDKIFNNSKSNDGEDTIMTDVEVSQEDDFRYWRHLCLKSQKFDSITAALDASLPGSQIYLRPAVYVENFVVTKPVDIFGIGGDKSKVILESKPNAGVVMTLDIATEENESTPSSPNSPAEEAKSPATTLVSSIRGCTLRQKPIYPREYCVEVASGKFLMEDCVVVSESYSSICVQQEGTAIIRRNLISGTSAGLTLYGCSSETIIEDNEFTSKYSGIEVMRSSNPIIRRNNIHGNEEAGIFVVDAKGLIEDNNVWNAGSGIQVSRGGSPSVLRNRIHNCEGGISLFENSSGTFEGNEIYDHIENNIFVGEDCNPSFTNNKSYRSKWNGVFVGEKGCGSFENNEIFENVAGGVLTKDASKPRFVNNIVRDNKRLGFMVYGLGHFEKNEILHNEGGIEVGRAGKPTLLDNNLVDNETVSQELKACIARGECTYSVSGTGFIPQFWWFCDTCEEGGNKGCCEACVQVCHKGHNLSLRRFSRFYCDCGAEWQCRIMPNKNN